MDPFGYAFGVVHTDGSAFKMTFVGKRYRADKTVETDANGVPLTRTYTQFRIALQCKDFAFIQRFQTALHALTGKLPPIRAFTRVMGKSTLTGLKDGYVFHGFKIKMAAKTLAEEFIRLNGAIARGDYSEIFAMPRERQLAILTAIIDADGYVTARGQIVIRQKDPAFIKALCDRLGIQACARDYAHQSAAQIDIPKSAAQHFDTYKAKVKD